MRCLRSPQRRLASILGTLIVCCAAEERKTYDGYRVYDVAVTGRQQASRLHQLAADGGYELWDDHGDSGWLQLQVSPSGAAGLEAALNTSSLPHRLRIADVQSVIDSQHTENEADRARGRAQERVSDSTNSRDARWFNLFSNYKNHADSRFGQPGDSGSQDIAAKAVPGRGDTDADFEGLNLGVYHRFYGIESFLKRLPERHPRHATLQVIGRTHEGRPLHMLRLRNDVTAPVTKKVMWIDCGMHAREWISPAICLYAISRLLGEEKHWLSKYDWHIVPVVNPDGYEYTHTTDRLWRKNRRPNYYCTGVDLNRNFAARWGTFGVTFNECGLTFPGYKSFSERESRAVRDAVLRDRHRTAAFNSIHSYGQLWLLPYGYSWFASKDVKHQRHVGRAATRAIRAVNGVPYRYGISSRLLYLDSGTSTDWAYRTGVRHSVAIEARDKGFYGFLLPPRLILPTAREIWAGLVEQARLLRR